MKIEIIQHGTPGYEQMVALRMEILRKPLGLQFTPEQLAEEATDFHVAAFENDKMLGCCVLTHVNAQTIQLRQMAVSNEQQGKGLGREIVAFAEQFSRQNGYTTLMMHARKTAIGFYKKAGYEVKGEEFIEVTIPHYEMIKTL